MAMGYISRGSEARGAASRSEVQAYASRTVDFLNVIEKAVSRMEADRAVVGALVDDTRRVLQQLGASPVEEVLDEDGRSCMLLSQAAASAHRQYDELIKFRDSARGHRNLLPEDGVVECCDQLIEAFASLYNVIEDLRDTIETIDSRKSPVIGTYRNAEDLINALRS